MFHTSCLFSGGALLLCCAVGCGGGGMWRGGGSRAGRRAMGRMAGGARGGLAAPLRRAFSAADGAVRTVAPDTQFTVKIGLEVHTQITAQSKFFSGAATEFMSPPNAQVALFDAALPVHILCTQSCAVHLNRLELQLHGVYSVASITLGASISRCAFAWAALPVLNKACVDQAVRTGLALGGRVNQRSSFVRKHYFYCDLPHGYQITQTDKPIVSGGAITIRVPQSAGGEEQEKLVRVNRIQLETDSGKSLHDLDPTRTHVDLNRAGLALMELVTEPDMTSALEANAFVRQLTAIMRRVGSCQCLFEQGGMRCDVNVSLHCPGYDGERVEIKNMNGLRAMLRAIEYEIERQTAMLRAGQKVRRQTRGFDGNTGTTFSLRDKESLLDYRFFPDPDLPDLVLSEDYVQGLARSLPELPETLVQRYRTESARTTATRQVQTITTTMQGLSLYDASCLVAEPGGPEFFEAMLSAPQTTAPSQPSSKVRSGKACVNWMLGELLGQLNQLDPARAGGRPLTFADSPVSPEQLAEVVDMVAAEEISGRVGQRVLQVLMEEARAKPSVNPLKTESTSATPSLRSVREIMQEKRWRQVSDEDHIAELCRTVLEKFPKEVQKYHEGHDGKKRKLMRHFVGQVMQLSAGKANPVLASTLLTKELQRDGPSATSSS
eukprot:g53324.t1